MFDFADFTTKDAKMQNVVYLIISQYEDSFTGEYITEIQGAYSSYEDAQKEVDYLMETAQDIRDDEELETSYYAIVNVLRVMDFKIETTPRVIF